MKRPDPTYLTKTGTAKSNIPIKKNFTNRYIKPTFILILFLTTGLMNIYAQSNENRYSFDLEIDPIAYALNGFSVHGGLNTGNFRYDIGIFGIEVPETFHGNDGFYNYIWGAGAKADYFFQGTNSGLYTGFGVDLTSSKIRFDASGKETSVAQFGAGVNIGYKINLTKNLFIKPWVGLSYLFNAEDIEVDKQIFEQSTIRPFPTVHIGWTF